MMADGAHSSTGRARGADTPGTVQRVLHVIRYFAENRESSLKEMSDALGLPSSTCHRLLEIFRREGFIETVPGQRKYRVGTELIRVCAELWSKQDVANLAAQFLEEMSQKSGETSVFSLYLPNTRKMCYAAKCDSDAALRFDIKLNRPNSILWGASGLSIAAFLPRKEVDLAYADEGPSPATGATLPTRDDLEERLNEVRDSGYASTFEEKMLDAVGIGAPVFERNGRVVGSLLIVYPSARLDQDRRDSFASLVCELAHKLSMLMVDQIASVAQKDMGT